MLKIVNLMKSNVGIKFTVAIKNIKMGDDEFLPQLEFIRVEIP